MVTVNARYALGKLHNPERTTRRVTAIKEAVTIVTFLSLTSRDPNKVTRWNDPKTRTKDSRRIPPCDRAAHQAPIRSRVSFRQRES